MHIVYSRLTGESGLWLENGIMLMALLCFTGRRNSKVKSSLCTVPWLSVTSLHCHHHTPQHITTLHNTLLLTIKLPHFTNHHTPEHHTTTTFHTTLQYTTMHHYMHPFLCGILGWPSLRLILWEREAVLNKSMTLCMTGRINIVFSTTHTLVQWALPALPLYEY